MTNTTLDTLVLDVETKNTFAEVGGREHLLELQPSVVCLYSYQKNKYLCFTEKQFPELKELLSTPAILVGFSSHKFDLPLLSHLFSLPLMTYPRIDLSDEIELRTGRLISLDALAQSNLDEIKKTHKSLDAPRLYAEGKIDELLEYCRMDVEITKRLYDKVKKYGELIIPARARSNSGEASVVRIDIPNPLFQ